MCEVRNRDLLTESIDLLVFLCSMFSDSMFLRYIVVRVANRYACDDVGIASVRLCVGRRRCRSLGAGGANLSKGLGSRRAAARRIDRTPEPVAGWLPTADRQNPPFVHPLLTYLQQILTTI